MHRVSVALPKGNRYPLLTGQTCPDAAPTVMNAMTL
jgi:hypothetical protein